MKYKVEIWETNEKRFKFDGVTPDNEPNTTQIVFCLSEVIVKKFHKMVITKIEANFIVEVELNNGVKRHIRVTAWSKETAEELVLAQINAAEGPHFGMKANALEIKYSRFSEGI